MPFRHRLLALFDIDTAVVTMQHLLCQMDEQQFLAFFYTAGDFPASSHSPRLAHLDKEALEAFGT